MPIEMQGDMQIDREDMTNTNTNKARQR